jgi:hypothetical protein
VTGVQTCALPISRRRKAGVGTVSKIIHRVWPAADVTPFITALLLGVSAYGFFKLSELIF